MWHNEDKILCGKLSHLRIKNILNSAFNKKN